MVSIRDLSRSRTGLRCTKTRKENNKTNSCTKQYGKTVNAFATPTRFGRITNYGSTVPCLFNVESSNRDCSVAQPYESTEGWLSNDKYQHSKDHLTAKINVEHRVQKKKNKLYCEDSIAIFPS